MERKIFNYLYLMQIECVYNILGMLLEIGEKKQVNWPGSCGYMDIYGDGSKGNMNIQPYMYS